ncbi:glutamine amidotransferase-like class 1 domain-containing protein 3, mitochondrial isoform X1 [Bos taurus]|uniref:glutamine amidotransferase-like class 1 domain-containing protein 3, mitochondrial isoform X1 n=1 Tax=Bos taurus TaxID=9913 RepID=UPI0028CB82CB|nr:glutamine amidotransferase-like class 1 domain-containing protein 3, mitochondrial isoform X1 [Bos taurus]
MAAFRALAAARLAVTPGFAPRPGLWPLPFGGPAPSSRAAFHASAPRPGPRVAVVLSGCGVYDGTELHEASSILVHLSRGGAEVQIFAPDVPQMHVIDHIKGQPSEGETRNVLTESARIARGKITDLAKLTAVNHDAAIFPGGFGAAKNLSTFAVDGGTCKVNRDVERVLKEFHQAGKPIGSGLLTSCFQAACPSLLGLLVRIMDGVGVQPALCQASAFIPALQEPLEACTSASPAELGACDLVTRQAPRALVLMTLTWSRQQGFLLFPDVGVPISECEDYILMMFYDRECTLGLKVSSGPDEQVGR